ncbi:MAG: hypothetical protein ACFFD4_35325 [Candidatus Odinarchaeota archaeon]
MVDATDVLSNSRSKHNPDGIYAYKTDGERFYDYWVMSVIGTASKRTLVHYLRV